MINVIAGHAYCQYNVRFISKRRRSAFQHPESNRDKLWEAVLPACVEAQEDTGWHLASDTRLVSRKGGTAGVK